MASFAGLSSFFATLVLQQLDPLQLSLSQSERLRKFALAHPPGLHEYRLNPAVFYLKFVKRDGMIRSGGIIMPIDHFEQLLSDICATSQ